MKKKSHESFSSAFENSWKVASNNPSDIQLWAGIRILNSWVKEDTDTLSLLQLFIPPSPSNKSTWNCPPLTPSLPSTTHTHTHRVQLPETAFREQQTELEPQSRVKASYHGSLAIIVFSTSGNGNKCAHVLKGPLGKISGSCLGTQWQALLQRKDLV